VQSTRTLFGYTQPTSIFQEPSYLGAFLGPCLMLTAIFVLEQRSSDLLFRHRWLNWLCLLALSAAVILSNSQAILVSLVVTLLFIFVRGLVRRLRLLRFIFMAIGGLLLIIPILQAIDVDFLTVFAYRFQYLILNILDPQQSAQVTSYAERSGSLQLGLEIWRQYPLLGVGLGNMGYYNIWGRATTNNAWLQVLVEQGAIGFVALVLVFGILLWQSSWLLRLHPNGSFWRTALISMICVLVLTAFSGLFTFNWTDPIRVFTLSIANLIYIQASTDVTYRRPTATLRLRLSAGRP
jgi:O-antigen ligase